MWDRIIQYFSGLEHHPVQRMIFLVGGLLVFWIIEGAIPLLPLSYKKTKVRHAAVNFGFTVIHLFIHTLLAILIVRLSDWCKAEQFGLAYWLNTNVLGTVIISFLALDFFGGWLVHITQHRVYILWKFHVVHHADNNAAIFLIWTCPVGKTAGGLRVYGDTDCWDVPVPTDLVGRDLMLAELYDAAVEGVQPLHTARWAKATLELSLAVLESARSRREVLLHHQVATLD